MTYFRIPLSADVLKTRRVYQREADQKDVGLWIRQRPQSVIILLSRRVPQAEIDRLPVHHHIRGVIVEYCRNVLPGKCIGGVAYQQACFTHRTGGKTEIQLIRMIIRRYKEYMLKFIFRK